MTDNYSVPVISCYLSKQFQTVCFLKILFCSHKYICIGIQLSEIIAHLLRKAVGDGKQGFCMQSQPLAFHSYCDHLIAFPRSNGMSKQRITAV